MNNLKSEIIEHLTNIKNYLIQLKEYYKVQAYSKVLIQLYTLKHPIYNYDDFIKYIKAGDRINKKVKELIETGKIDYEIENIKNDNIYLFKQELNEIYGIGKVKIDEIIANNITSIEQLKNNQHLLNNKQKIGLLYYDDIKKRIRHLKLDNS